ncbi:hypothetical protein OIDMADRAFT_62242 [Oidiodendron maius Zn]|uniref:Zn(2)-C6 fungal-type domain-containing protein n=1 Tax=Oidiodendron maius (strain Zn) TaxID=913774 RepID=A0A0C3C1P4_OIDMZ|nr:hypothetical protein OIDMADRAFT_62242 [Oidiodendron maius Zn]
MVGVAGRSRGCKTCRQARVKCDDAYPICKRCSRLKLTCSGRNPYPVFVDGLSHLQIRAEDDDNCLPSQQGDVPRGICRTPIATIRRPPTANYNEIFLSHLVKNLLSEKGIGDQSSRITDWVVATTQSNLQTPTSQLAVGAFAAGYYGKRLSDHAAMNQGSLLYVRALREIQRDLRHPERVVETMTLASSLFLAGYEITTFDNTSGWLTHFLGIGQLVKFRGPHRHQTGIDRDLFLAVRSSVALAYLVRKKRCFLEEFAWKIIPWAANPGLKNSTDYLFDIFCDLPSIMEDINILQGSPVASDYSTTPLWKALGDRIMTCLQSLYQWRVEWQEKFPETYYPVGLDRLRDMKAAQLESYPFSIAIFFTEPIRATEICLYNCMQILLFRALDRIPRSVVPKMTPSSLYPRGIIHMVNPSLLLSPGEGSIETFTSEICRMVYFQLLSYPGSSGAMQLMFPLQVASRNVHPESRTSKWLTGIIALVADGYGLGAVKFADKIFADTDSFIVV